MQVTCRSHDFHIVQNITVTLVSNGECQLERPLTSFKVKEVTPGVKYQVSIPDIYW